MATLGQRIKEMRKASSVTQQELAKVIGVKTYRSVQYVEQDKNNLNNHQLQALADFFDVSLDYLIGRTNDPQGYYHKEFSPSLKEWIRFGESLTPEQRESIMQTIKKVKDDPNE